MGYRTRWLQAQYKRDTPTEEEYRPEPYQQLASVLRAAGDFGCADLVAFERLRLEKVKMRSTPGSSPERQFWRWFAQRFGWKLFAQWPFKFGLSPVRALSTFAVFWLVGVGALYLLAGDLKIDTSSVGTVAAVVSGGTDRVVINQQPVKKPVAEIPCGNYINQFLYPLDVMVPFLDLRQETRCRFSNTQPVLIFAKGIYAILGWLLTSGVILTLSGVVRRRLEA